MSMTCSSVSEKPTFDLAYEAKEAEKGIQMIKAVNSPNLDLLRDLCEKFPQALNYRSPEGHSVWEWATPARPNEPHMFVEVIGILCQYNAPDKHRLYKQINISFVLWQSAQADPTAFILSLVEKQYIDPSELAKEIIREPAIKKLFLRGGNVQYGAYNEYQKAIFQKLIKICQLEYEPIVKEAPYSSLHWTALQSLTGLPNKEYRKLILLCKHENKLTYFFNRILS